MDEWVSSSTSQDWPTICISVPIREISWPHQYSRKFRLWKEAIVRLSTA